MSYSEIIEINRRNTQCSWWPKFAYHYTDVTNAVNIMREGFLYSRIEANRLGVMQNDNASRQVINVTETTAQSAVRFYFRPKTPTQYYNEGFKHPLLRYDGDPNANVPVPIFFVFDLAGLLLNPSARFSERGQAGHGTPSMQGEEAFRQLDFEKIYSTGSCTREVLQYRHAEISYPSAFALNGSLKYIMCRNDIERLTLMNLLREYDASLIREYSNMVKVCPSDMFENNGLFITSIVYQKDKIRFELSDYTAKHAFTKNAMRKNGVDSLPPVLMRIRFEWVNDTNRVIHSLELTYQIDYNRNVVQLTDIPSVADACTLKLRIYFDDQFVCLSEHPLADSELI